MLTAAARILRSAVPRRRTLRIAILLSLAIHTGLLAIRFSGTPTSHVPMIDTLEVTLVNTQSKAAPIAPQVLAQQNLNAGGEADSGVAASPLPRDEPPMSEEALLAALRKRQEELEQQQRALLTQLASRDAAAPAHADAHAGDPSIDPGDADETLAAATPSAPIAAIKERVEHYNARPRLQFVGPSAQSVDTAAYVEDWRRKIERLGTEHYPDEARGKVYGSLQLTVYIGKDGSLQRMEIDKPSPHAVLNLAAQRIVQLAAPFPPLPEAIARNTDVLAITRTWHFTDNRLDTDAP